MPVASSSSKRTHQGDATRPAKRLKTTVPVPAQDGNSDTPLDSASEDDSESDVEDDKQAMLAALEAHGRMMFASLDTPTAGPSRVETGSKATKRTSKASGSAPPSKIARLGGHELDGLVSEDSGDDSELEDGEGFDEDDGDDGVSQEDSSDDSQDESVAEEEVLVPTVVFGGDAGRSSVTSTSKADFKRFMSSKSAKMMNVKKPDEDVIGRRKKVSSEDEAADDEDRSNAVLDKELHGLLLNNLLPGSANASKPSEKRNQMSSRLLELASIAGLGEGTSARQATAYKSQPTKIRSNILKAQERRSEKARVEAQAAGSWVKGSGGLGDLGGSSGKDKGLTLAAKKRQERERARRSKSDERGLSMGVGRFKGGVLTLSKSEIAKGSAVPEKFSANKKKGKGKKGGGRK